VLGASNGLFTICGHFPVMHAISIAPGLVLLSLLGSCGPAAPVAGVGVGVLSGASIPIFHRSPIDMVLSAATRQDCSAVNLDKGERYCRSRDRAPETQEFCTRSLGIPDCWDDSSKLPNHPREIADGPRNLNKDQEADRTKRWPGLW
jgi:hypothetical protein